MRIPLKGARLGQSKRCARGFALLRMPTLQLRLQAQLEEEVLVGACGNISGVAGLFNSAARCNCTQASYVVHQLVMPLRSAVYHDRWRRRHYLFAWRMMSRIIYCQSLDITVVNAETGELRLFMSKMRTKPRSFRQSVHT